MDIEYLNQTSKQNKINNSNSGIQTGQSQSSNIKIAEDQDLHALYRTHVEKKNLEETKSNFITIDYHINIYNLDNSINGLLNNRLENVVGGTKYAWNTLGNYIQFLRA